VVDIELKENGEPRYFPSVVLTTRTDLRYSDGSGNADSVARSARIVVNVGLAPDEMARGVLSNQLATCVANARLISAAPDLLEALKDARSVMWHRSHCPAHPPGCGDKPCNCGFEAADEAADDAIRKAEGRAAIPRGGA
jgi:hypothetical protein